LLAQKRGSKFYDFTSPRTWVKYSINLIYYFPHCPTYFKAEAYNTFIVLYIDFKVNQLFKYKPIKIFKYLLGS